MTEMFGWQVQEHICVSTLWMWDSFVYKLEGEKQHELRQPGYPYFQWLQGKWAEDITVWISRPAKGENLHTAPGWAGDMLRYAKVP